MLLFSISTISKLFSGDADPTARSVECGQAIEVVFLSWRMREEPKARAGIESRQLEDALNGGNW